MEETVETALGAAFPGRVIDRTFGVGPSWNGANETVGVVFADGSRVFCKVAVAGDGSRIAREIAVLRYLDAGRPISGPEVLAGDPDASVPYLVTAPAPGRELLGVWEEAEEAQREALLRRVGATLATLHAERFETHGEIVGGSDEGEIGSRSGSALILDPAPWPDVLRATIERTREIGTSERLADHYDAVFDCVEANRDRLGGAPAALLHGDVAKPNLFVTDDGGVGVDAESRTDTGPDGITPIDWELAHVGDPVRELQRAKRQFVQSTFDPGTDRHVDAFYDGYREQASGLPAGFEDRYRLYDAVTYLGVSGFFEKWEGRVDESTEAIAADVREEMTRRLDAAGGDGHE